MSVVLSAGTEKSYLCCVNTECKTEFKVELGFNRTEEWTLRGEEAFIDR